MRRLEAKGSLIAGEGTVSWFSRSQAAHGGGRVCHGLDACCRKGHLYKLIARGTYSTSLKMPIRKIVTARE